mmetsp:Transcript_3555/g.8721  ORF Transcript_3555/g.8721 Transcript_3555/m.8721 type:complete len:229 (+) Transcript_3555:662-1348(+)
MRSLSAEACRATTSWSCLTAAALGAGDFGCGALALGAGAGGVSGFFSHLMTSSSPSFASNWWNSSLPQGSAKVKSAVPGPVASQLRTVRFAQVLPLFTSTRSPLLNRTSDFLAFGSGAASTAKPPSRDAARSRVTLTKVSTFLSVYVIVHVSRSGERNETSPSQSAPSLTTRTRWPTDQLFSCFCGGRGRGGFAEPLFLYILSVPNGCPLASPVRAPSTAVISCCRLY